MVGGVPVGRELRADDPMEDTHRFAPGGAGSVIVVVGTDAPLLPGQCKALARRVPLGLGRTGTTSGGHFSGDIARRRRRDGHRSPAPPHQRRRELLSARGALAQAEEWTAACSGVAQRQSYHFAKVGHAGSNPAARAPPRPRGRIIGNVRP